MSTETALITGNISLEIQDGTWDIDESFVYHISTEVLNTISPTAHKGQDYSVHICLTNNAQVQELNKEYRHKDKPTNVLTFEYEPDEFDALEPEVQLGDIFIAREIVKEEALQQQKTFEAHVAHLLIHGLLHSFGYDHIHNDEAEVMEDLEVRILHKLGYTDPYNPITDEQKI